MNRRSLMMMAWAVVLVVTVLVGTRFSGVIRAQGHDHSQHRPPAQRPVTPSVPRPSQQSAKQKTVAANTSASAEATLRMIHSQQLPSLQSAIGSAIRQIEGGNSPAALAELKRAQVSLAALQKMLEQQVKPAIVNARCPIMGAPVQAVNVPLGLTRSFEGQRVAFCCAGCPNAWDRLPYTEKAAKLAVAMDQPTPQ